MPPPWEMKEPDLDAPGRVPPTLDLCYGCMQYVYPETELCPHCGGDVRALAAEQREVEEAIADLRRKISALSAPA